VTGRPTLLLYCQHSLGLGHLMRAWALSAQLATEFEVTLVSGGASPVGLTPPSAVETIELPPLAQDADGTLFALGAGVSVDHVKAERRARLVEAYRHVRPDVLVIELFPFGRRKFRDEIMALLDETRHGPRPVVATSVRDLLVDRGPEQQAHDDRARALVDTWFDLVLVHTDPRFATLDDTFHPSVPLSTPVHHTGFVVAERCGPEPEVERRGILVSGGGGRFAESLYMMAIEAHEDLALASLPMTIITGPLCPALTHARVDSAAQRRPGIHVEHTVDDVCGAMRHASVSVSQCGYNTALDIVRAGAPAIVVPFDDNGDSEQTARAHRLERLGIVRVVRAAEGPRALADAIAGMPRAARPPFSFDIDGGRRSTDILLTAMRQQTARRFAAAGAPA
jgi:predicted glycosyltransferase